MGAKNIVVYVEILERLGARLVARATFPWIRTTPRPTDEATQACLPSANCTYFSALLW